MVVFFCNGRKINIRIEEIRYTLDTVRLEDFYLSESLGEVYRISWARPRRMTLLAHHLVLRKSWWFCCVLLHSAFLLGVSPQHVNRPSRVLLATLFVLWTSDSRTGGMGKHEAVTCAHADHDLQTSMSICPYGENVPAAHTIPQRWDSARQMRSHSSAYPHGTALLHINKQDRYCLLTLPCR